MEGKCLQSRSVGRPTKIQLRFDFLNQLAFSDKNTKLELLCWIFSSDFPPGQSEWKFKTKLDCNPINVW